MRNWASFADSPIEPVAGAGAAMVGSSRYSRRCGFLCLTLAIFGVLPGVARADGVDPFALEFKAEKASKEPAPKRDPGAGQKVTDVISFTTDVQPAKARPG